MDLRDYQSAAIAACRPLLGDGVICTLPTGAGKTVTAVALAREEGARVVWFAHRRELLQQAKDAIEDAGGDVGLILAGEQEDRSAQFQVASVQTLARRDLPEADLLVVDECHHARGDSYARAIAAYRRRLGLTATPARLDGKGLRGAGFNHLVVGVTAAELCAQGVLHAPIVYGSAGPDMTRAHKRGGDFAAEDLRTASLSAALTGQVLETWKKRAENRRTFGFAVDVDHARGLTERFLAAGVPTELVTGETPRHERAGALARLAAGITRVLWNVQVLTEGVDVPSCEVISVARPTDSLVLHLQIIGRAMRACEGKDGALVLDHSGNHFRHGLVTDDRTWSLDDKPKGTGEAPVKECPGCHRIIAAGCRTCPGCGHEFPLEDRTSESAAELLPIGHADALEERVKRWSTWLAVGRRLAGPKFGNFFSEKARHYAIAIAKRNYRSRYGSDPRLLGDRLAEEVNRRPLINVANVAKAASANPADWDADA